jgi:hypothetical protein
MRPARRLAIVLALFCVYLPLHARARHLVVTGKLTQLDTESTWAIQLNPVITVDGHQVSFVVITTPHPQKLEPLQDEFVQATGTFSTVNTGDTGDYPVLHLSSVHSVKYNNPDKDKSKLSFWASVVNFFSPTPL